MNNQAAILSRSEENLRNTSNEVSNIKSRLIDVEHEKIMLVKQLTQFRSKYNYITRQKDKEIQRLKSELERQYEKEFSQHDSFFLEDFSQCQLCIVAFFNCH
ncbi:uncharacterized protein LOC129924978 isoform X3 [Biomphalaria glabrata]|uniref:Uncharacterized protein LOC129924978 isoform X3 n=1 Tax=Biomphalaria glabrata TaxID=6526 RepID=A0A9W2ZV33_BIOGL|nr:uncharacterized protein LOC129924978 isoform X3 [Biomphalaria glabrata]